MDQLGAGEQAEVVSSLSGEENFDKQIKTSFRKVLSSFQAKIKSIIDEKKNLPEETVLELKRNQLRALICSLVNRCFILDQIKELFPLFPKDKNLSLQTFNDWIDNMKIDELQREITTFPTHFYQQMK